LFEGTNADVRQHEEELFVCGSKCGQRLRVGVRARADFARLGSVIWSSGRVLRRRYTTAPVLQVSSRTPMSPSCSMYSHVASGQVALCRFQGSAESNLCLLHSGCLTTWAPSGTPSALCLCSPPSSTEPARICGVQVTHKWCPCPKTSSPCGQLRWDCCYNESHTARWHATTLTRC
jgi:hypothetical protein